MTLPIHAYVAPVDDQIHALEVAGAGNVLSIDFGLMGNGTINQNDLKPFISAAGEFAATKWAHTNAIGDKGQVKYLQKDDGYNETHFSKSLKDALNEFVAEGYTATAAPTKYGGFGAPKAVDMVLTEIFNAANLGLSLGPLLSKGAVEAINLAGSDTLKEKYLPRLISGENFGTMMLTESDAGSALEKIKTSAAQNVATKNADGTYNIKGQKIFITYGEHDASDNIVHLVLARTDANDRSTKGLSLFVVPKYLVDENGNRTNQRNGIESIELHEKMGIHSSPTHVMELGGDKGAAIGELVGKEGEGMKNMFIMMNNARQGVAISGVGMAERALQASIRYSAQRKQGNDITTGEKDIPTIRHINQREDALISHAKIMASRMICYHAAIMSDLAEKSSDPVIQKKASKMAGLLTPVAKAGSTKMGHEISTLALEMTGGYGYMEESGFSQYVRDSLIPKIYEGTNAIQAMDLAGRKLLHDGGVTMKSWLQETRQELLSKQTSKRGGIINKAISALKDLETATDIMLGLGAKGKIENAMGLAESYLNMVHTVVGGVMMARSSIVAAGKTQTPRTEYYKQQADIYADCVLPESKSLLQVIKRKSNALVKTNINHLLQQYRADM